ncbi:CoxG family protein [Sulfitobacter sp. 1A12126]|uniref:CoxG family protein n=1 Tax=Sulfitobacter sp. 1A12126 TaxID=3368591 RepID=UPI003746DC3E
MELTGRYELDAPPEVVWDALFHPDVLAASIPGCESLQAEGPATYAATVKLKVGPVSARFKGNVEIVDAEPCRSCRITGKGSGGIAGVAHGASLVALEATATGTVLTYTADAKVGGKLASLGSRLIESTSRKLADQFFSNFATHLKSRRENAG